MALDNTLNVEITASVDGLKSGLNQAEKGVKNFGNAADTMTKKTGKMAGVVKSNAVPTLTSFSQVMQDAPYGIRGVANNITQLTSQFGYLSKSAGGSGAALKAMVGSLTGPAGILLAVSVITSLWVSYEKELKNVFSGTENLVKKNEDLTKSLEDYEAGLSAVNRATIQGSKDATKELTELSLLKSQIDNTNLSNKERVKAVDEIQKRYPSYLGNITDEDALIGGLDTKYNELTAAILKTAKAQAASKLISEKYQQILSLESKLAEENLKLGNAAIANNNANNELKEKGVLISASEAEYAQRAGKRYEEARETAVKTGGQIIGLQNEILSLTKQITENGGIVPLDVKGGGVGKIKAFKGEVVKELSTFKSEIDPLMGTIATSFDNIIPIEGMLANLPKIDFALMEYLNQLKEFNAAAESIIKNGVQNAFSGLGNAIGTAIGEGTSVLKAVGASMLDALGGILVQFGELAIAYGVANLALYKAITSGPNPVSAGVAIAAGIALVAIGSAISSFSKGALGGGGGGSDYSSGSSGSSRSYGSSTSYSNSGSNGGTYVFEIAGTKLIGVLKNTLDRNKALGGKDNLLFG